MCGGVRRTVTVAAFRVACVSSLYRVSYVDSPTMLSKAWKVNADLIASADGCVILELVTTTKEQRTVYLIT